MFRKALWNSPPNPATVEKGTFFSFQHLASNPHGFSKDKKKKTNKAIDTISQIVQAWPSRGEQSDTAPHPGIILPTHRQPFLQSIIFINSCQSGHLLSQIITCITYYLSSKRRCCATNPQGDMTRRSEEVPRSIKLTNKKKQQKIHEGKKKQQK